MTDEEKTKVLRVGNSGRMNAMSGLVTAAGIAAMLEWLPPGFLRPAVQRDRPKDMHKCALPGCEVLTSHNGGYCCAAHCKEHRSSHVHT